MIKKSFIFLAIILASFFTINEANQVNTLTEALNVASINSSAEETTCVNYTIILSDDSGYIRHLFNNDCFIFDFFLDFWYSECIYASECFYEYEFEEDIKKIYIYVSFQVPNNILSKALDLTFNSFDMFIYFSHEEDTDFFYDTFYEIIIFSYDDEACVGGWDDARGDDMMLVLNDIFFEVIEIELEKPEYKQGYIIITFIVDNEVYTYMQLPKGSSLV